MKFVQGLPPFEKATLLGQLGQASLPLATSLAVCVALYIGPQSYEGVYAVSDIAISCIQHESKPLSSLESARLQVSMRRQGLCLAPIR